MFSVAKDVIIVKKLLNEREDCLQFRDMSKSKLFSVLFFFVDVVLVLWMGQGEIACIVLMLLLCFMGLALVWIGHGLGPVKLRIGVDPVWLEWIGWMILLTPLWILLEKIFGNFFN